MFYLIKLQIACMVIIFFISVMYFTTIKDKSKLSKSFGAVLIATPINLILDMITVYTVNNMDTVPGWINDLAHRIFLISLAVVVYLFCDYVFYLVADEIEDCVHHKPNNRLMQILLGLSVLYSLFAKPAYVIADWGSNYSDPLFAAGTFFAVLAYDIVIAVSLFRHWNHISGRRRSAIALSVAIQAAGFYMQLFHTEMLTSGFAITMMALAFYLTLENPDAILLQEVEQEKKKVEELSASKSRFMSVVSHEIRTPMNAVVGMTDLLLREQDNLTDKQIQYLKNIKHSGAALVMIVNDILDQSKIEAGKMEIVTAPYEFRSMAEDVRMIIENRIDNKPVELIYEIGEDVPDGLIGDSLRIRQILINLMNNAVKFTEEGYIKFSVQCVERLDQEIKLYFSIKDSGQGIRPEDVKKLGQAFVQVDTKVNHEKEGTGLGLSISRDFIDLMGGQLEVSSTYGEGTEFYFTITQGIVDQDTSYEKAWKLEDDFTAPDARVLIVDDTELNLMIAEELLEPIEMQVDTVESGEKALELVAKKQYDLIFMDYMMPCMDGVETTRRIRTLEVEWSNVPVVALSGDSSDATKQLFREAGMNDAVEKPVELAKMKEMLRKWLPEDLVLGGLDK